MKGMIEWFARNGIAANLLMVLILAAGIWTMFSRITLEVFPSFERDIVNIGISYRGATPAEVEEAVIIRAEEAIADLDGIEEISSFAYEGSGRLSVEVSKGHNPRDLLDDIKNRIDTISTFPEDVERAKYAVQVHKHEVISVAVYADLPEHEMREFGDRVLDDILALPEVSLAELDGVRPYELAIEISEDALDRYGLTFDHIVQAIRASSIDQPAGAIKTSRGKVLLRTRGQGYVAEDFAKISVLSRRDGTNLALGDIATIRDGFEEEPVYALFNGRPAVMIEVYRTGGESAIDVAAAVRNYVAQAKEILPDGVNIDYWRDRSRIVKLRLETLLSSALQGGILVFLCLALSLRMSVALWVCIGIPVSFMGALALMPEMGLSINVISLFGFILVLGIVVDDAIITGENVYSHLKRAESGIEAAIAGAQEVSVPVTFGLLTTIAAFLPLMFIEGMRGPMFAQISMIAIPVLVFSWIESKLILPSHLSHVKIKKKEENGPLKRLQATVADGLEAAISRFYAPALKIVIEFRYLVVAIFIAVSLIIITFVVSGRYSFTFFPRIQSETARGTLTMETGTSEELTQHHIKLMTEKAIELKKKYTDPESGESVIRNILTSVNSAEKGRVSLELVPPEERTVDVNTSKIVDQWRLAIGQIPGARELNFRAETGRGGSPIDIQLSGPSIGKLKEVIKELRQRLGEYPGVFDIQDTLEDGNMELVLSLKPEAEMLGLTSAELGRQVRQAFFGADVQRIQRGRNDVRVIVKYPLEERSHIDSLDVMRIRTAGGAQVPIGNVADVGLGQGFATITRIDRKRIINVMADIDKKSVNMAALTRDLKRELEGLRSRYPGVSYSFEGEQREQRESFGSMFYGIIFTLFSIYGLLAIPLRSYLQPLVVMMVIPFSIVGALLGHMLMGLSLSVMSLMGMIALIGVVVNDSLVLVDWINGHRNEGGEMRESVMRAGVARFRPILLTSITTFAGLAPLMLDKSTQAQFLIPMAVSLGFGILYATMLSLILVPAGYIILHDIIDPFYLKRGLSLEKEKAS
ncbi:MAG: efflux RND transporter permease subunit [bacterium]|nr:efflux RND transporter permease subunit [bacterium]